MTAILTVTAKNQVTFPAELLKRLRITKGDKLFIKEKGKIIEIEKVETGLRSLQGVLATTTVGKKKTMEEVISKAEKKEAKRLMNEG